ncbi:MAG: hypothetical protein EIB84_07000 [Spiroplasma poulsonii]|nr:MULTISPECIES: hypothetical protein [Spiroplasma]MBW1242488.1 hypothetical protein [Spiroplasma poulsonii]UNF62154.1 hypothetical protein MNU24_01435 [Spiroplasma poulsonii]
MVKNKNILMMQKRVEKQLYYQLVHKLILKITIITSYFKFITLFNNYFLNNSKINLYKITPQTKQESKGCDNKNDN